MKLLVIGASRGIGLEVVKQALSQGYEVRAFARSAASIRLSNPRLEKRSGSALNVSEVASAITGVDAVILTLGVSGGAWNGFGAYSPIFQSDPDRDRRHEKSLRQTAHLRHRVRCR